MPAFTLLSRNFQSAMVFQRSGGRGGNGTNAQEDSLMPSASWPFAFTLTQWLDSTIYEDKSA